MTPRARKPAPLSKPRRRTPLWRWVFFAATAFVTLTTATAVGLFMGYVRTLPPIERLEYYDPPEVTQVTSRTGVETIGEFKKQRRYVTSINAIPLQLQRAFLAIEDARFYQHLGVDPIGILRAMITNFKSGRLTQGGSTITQQLTRNILPEEVGFERSISRKIKEAILAFQIERRYSKEQILEFYLNHIEFVYNSFGVRAAASTYFSKEMNELTLAECATLAAMPQNPSIFNPFTHPQSVVKRRDQVLKRMLDLGWIDQEQYRQAFDEPLIPHRGYGIPSQYPYFLDALEKDLNRYYGLSDVTLKQGGFRITATIDPAIQQACITALREGLIENERTWQKTKLARHYAETKEWDGVLREGQTMLMKITDVSTGKIDVELEDYRATIPLPEDLPYYEPANIVKDGNWIDVTVTGVQQGKRSVEGILGDVRPIQGAVVVLDVRSGEVLALVGGSNFYSAQGGAWNLAIQGGRQPGSVFKPFFYAAALEKQIPPNTIIVDEPIQYGAQYRPINYEKIYYGPTTMIEALEHSRNVVTLRLFEALGIRRTLEFIRRFDFTQPGARWNIPEEISTSLGTIDATPFEMAAAYQAIANHGVAIRPQFVRSALDRDGDVAFPIKHEENPVMDPVTAYQLQYMLRQVTLGGTGQDPIGQYFPSPPFPPICGKTGTTSDNYDAWFAGFTPDLVIMVQVGFEPRRPMGPRMTGGRLAGPIWAAIFREICKTSQDWQMEFDIPAGLEFADICAVTGKRVGEVCAQQGHKTYRAVPFRLGTVPGESCNDVPLTPLIQPVGSRYAGEWSSSPIHGFARRPDVVMPGEDGGEPDPDADPGSATVSNEPDVPAVQLNY